MLSLKKGKIQMCTECFEKRKVPLDQLDSHVHAPYNPGNFVAYHPFTKRYADTRDSDEETDTEESSWSDPDNKKTPRKRQRSAKRAATKKVTTAEAPATGNISIQRR